MIQQSRASVSDSPLLCAAALEWTRPWACVRKDVHHVSSPSPPLLSPTLDE